MNRSKINLLIMMMVLSCWDIGAAPFSVQTQLCNGRENPVGVSLDTPRLSWKTVSQNRGFMQQSYQIVVADNASDIKLCKGSTWDSGVIKSSNSIQIKYAGINLRPTTKYYWRVRVRGTTGKFSPWSEIATFSTALRESDDWQGAKWIALEKDGEKLYPGIHAPLVWRERGAKKSGNYALPLFRKEFVAKRDLQQAIVCVAGLGHFDLLINGAKVGDHFLDAGWTNYNKSTHYVTFDITSLLSRDNTVGVMLGNGFYNVPRERYFKQLVSFGAPKLKMIIRLDYQDNTTEYVITDENWRVTRAPITYSSIYGGEDYDARLFEKGWCQCGFDATQWQSPVICKTDIELRPQEQNPLRIDQILPAQRQYTNAKGRMVIDFGQNFSGIIRLSICGDRGTCLKLHPAELLHADSTANQTASGSPYYWQYTLRGDSLETWQPQFTYYGFRYVEIEGDLSKIKNLEIDGLHTTSANHEVGTFTCSSKIFNDTHQLIDWAIRSNLASILTDCPHREKLGWLEVAHLMQSSMQYRYDLSTFYPKLMSDMRESQRLDGCIPSISPEYVRFSAGFEDSPEWGSAFIIIPWTVYKWYGDDSLLAAYYNDMRRYLDYLSSRATNSIIEYGLGDWFDLGPKAPGYAQLTSPGVTATALYYQDASILREIAQLLGRDEDVIYYQKLCAEIKKNFNLKYFDSQTKIYDRNSQTASALALYFDLVDEKDKNAVFENLKTEIERCNYALTSGDIGYHYLLKALEQNGGNDIIYKMNNKYDRPGYGWQLAHEATSLTESWQAYGSVSNNHCMLGHLMEWFYAGLGGLKQNKTSIAFKELLFEPQTVNDIQQTKISYETPYGTARCETIRRASYTEVLVEVPANSSAKVVLCCDNVANLTESGLPIGQSTCCKIDKIESQRITVGIKSGLYNFKIQQ